MLDRVAAKIREYHQSAGDISRHTDRGYLSAMLKLLAGRVLHDQGPKNFWWYQLDRVPLSQMKGYIDIKEYGTFMALLNPYEYRYLADNKVEFYRRCKEHDLPTPDVLAVITPEPFQTPFAIPNPTSKKEFTEILESLQPGGYVLKPIDGAEGHGVLLLLLTPDGVSDVSGKSLGHDDLWAHCQVPGRRGPGYILQPMARIHPDLKPINPGIALGTVRMITYLRPDNTINHFCTFYRVPRAHAIWDNFADGTIGNMVGVMDISTGRMTHAIARTADNPLLRDFDRHPDTNEKFDGFMLPLWQDVRELAARAQRAFPEMRMIGWDIGITDAGVTLIEANAYFSHVGSAMVVRRGTRADFEACYLETKAADQKHAAAHTEANRTSA